MAANKFATMLHRNTNKITLILVYAILEWILIVLLLLNSLFSYLIIKFADYFGLKRPCLWCSRLDHIFDSAHNKNSYRDLVCEAHASEISKLGYCLNHRKLTESHDMCEDCSSSSLELSKKFAFFPWMKQIGMIQDGGGDSMVENGDANCRCSCCGESLESKLHPPFCLIKPSWGVFDYTQKGNLVDESGFDDKTDEDDHSDHSRSDFVTDRCEQEEVVEKSRGIQLGRIEEETQENCSASVSNADCKEIVADEDGKLQVVMEKEQQHIKDKEDELTVPADYLSSEQTEIEVSSGKEKSSEIPPQHLEFYIDGDDCHLIPIEQMDFSSREKERIERNVKPDQGNFGSEDFVLEFDKHIGTMYELVMDEGGSLEENVPLLSGHDSEEEPRVAVFEARELDEMESDNDNEDASATYAEGDLVKEECQQVAIAHATEALSHVEASSATAKEEMDSDVNPASEKELQMQNEEMEVEISIGTEIPDDDIPPRKIPDHEPIDDIPTHEIPDQEPIDDIGTPESSCSTPCVQDPSTSSAHDQGSKQAEEVEVEFKTIAVENNEEGITSHLLLHLELNEIEEEKVPDTPTSVDTFHHLHKKFLLLERRESGVEESLDGSVISDIDAGDGVMTMEKLKSALRAERKALNALYAELEEERSASAVAANQTMAMINRLQEEKAAMQMEALQYQRMMEEQSEYDQEALQLLNELMVKREKEKAELEKELEIYRKKVQDYEAKEKMMLLRRKDGSTRSRTSSASCSNAEDSDGLSVDLNHEVKEDDGFHSHQESSDQNTPADAVLYLEESLANFEEERLSILEQLKVLEERLFSLSEEEDQHFEDAKPVKDFYEANGNGYNGHFDYSIEVNGAANGHYKQMNGKHHQEKRITGAKAKRLLPLFDAIDAETENGELNGHAEGVDLDPISLQKSVNKSEIENKKLAIEEEVDHVYDRLQALEADREFLKHCITSLRKGDKGIDLLEEILQHLRDLRSVELRVRNMGDGVL